MKRIFLISLLTFYNGSLFCQTINKTELTEQTRLEKEYLQKGEDHFFEKRFGTALQWLKKAIEINPDNATAHAYIGDILLTLGEYNDALKHYRVAAELMSNPSLEYFRMGQIYYLQNDRLDSEKFFEKALVSNPELAEAHFYIGLISYRNGRNRQETLSHLKLFREKRPNFIDIAGLDKVIALLEDPKADLDKSKDLLTIDPLR
ncbi:MAG: tetratricopeptide repeat protein, partial [Leptonema sp. (in: Bacteria)]|nr:tetratricopeptide repeat protein [Leptonema sp. (in: bacteria)]